MTTTFFAPPSDPNFISYISKVAYFFTGASLTIGIGQFIWTPVAIKYGRRPVYLICLSLLTVCNIWAACSRSYGSMLGARLLTGIAAGAPELVAPLTLTDIFFLHQRGRVMA
jgi:MFS family permease